MPSGMRPILYKQCRELREGRGARGARAAGEQGEAEKAALPLSEDMLRSQIQAITQRPAKG
jgi:hypothetical protein